MPSTSCCLPRSSRARQLIAVAVLLATAGCSHDSVTDPVVTLGPVLAGAPLPPVASYTMITQGPVAKSILTVDGSASSDPNSGGGITNYAWSWGDGAAVQNTGTTAKAVHAYQNPGTFTLGLTVTNTAALTNTATQSITVAARDTFTFSFAPTTPAAGQAISFTPVNAAAPVGDTSSFQWTFAGKVVTQTSGLTAPTGITYDSAGTWTVRVQRAYRSGPRQIITQPITIGAAVAPTGSVSCAPSTVSNSTSVTCTPTLAANSGALSTYAWTETGGTPASAATASYTFTFNSGASLTPSLTATNTYQKSAAFPYTLTAASPAGSISCAPTSVTNGTSVTCSSASVTPGAGTLSTYAWAETGGTPASATTASYTFTWNTGASHAPSLTATNSYGQNAVFTATLTAPAQTVQDFGIGADDGCAAKTLASTLYCWGNSTNGGTGLGYSSATPDTVPKPQPANKPMIKVSMGLSGTACGLVAGGTAYCWGWNASGQVGNNVMSTTPVTAPTAVSTAIVTTWTAISVGNTHTCGIANAPAGVAGKLYCWGDNSAGQVGMGSTTTKNYLVPTLTSGARTYTAVSAGDGYTCAVASTGAGYCWGGNSEYEGGTGSSLQTSAPTQISTTLVSTWTTVTAGYQTTCGIDATASKFLYCWGSQAAGVTGDGVDGLSQYSKPRKVTFVPNGSWAGVTLAASSACAWTSTQFGYCWGENQFGEFGNPVPSPATTVYTPTAIAGGASNWVKLRSAVLGNTLCGLTTANVLLCMGSNTNGALGRGSITPPSDYTPDSPVIP